MSDEEKPEPFELPPEILAMHDRMRTRVIALCEAYGYGFVMHEAERAWREKEEREGRPGSQHTVGPCGVFTERCNHGGRPTASGCDLCFGCGWVFKREGPTRAAELEAAAVAFVTAFRAADFDHDIPDEHPAADAFRALRKLLPPEAT